MVSFEPGDNMYILEVCNNLSTLGVILFIKKLLKIISIIVPVLLVLLVSIDFSKAVIASDDNEMKKVQSLAVKRILIALAVFFIPIIIETTFSLTDKTSGWIGCYNNAEDSVVETLAQADKEKLIQKESERQALIKAARESAKAARKKIQELRSTGQYKKSQCKIGEAAAPGIDVVMSDFYDGGWSYVARFKNPKKSNLAAKCIKDATENKNIKYEVERYTELWDEAAKYNFDVSKVNKTVYTTCCPLVSVCAKYAGVNGISERGKTFTCDQVLDNMVNSIKQTGEFEIIPWSKIQSCDNLKQGDILISRMHEGMAY